jgi:DNA polymerase III epsilon subunit-like protein
MIINHWHSQFTAQYGHLFPTTYLVLDIETSGNKKEEDVVVELGHVIVKDCLIADKLNVVLNWYKHAAMSAATLDAKLFRMRDIIGSAWKLLPSKLHTEGIDPIAGLNFYYDLLHTWIEAKLPFVAQNGLATEERILNATFKRFLGKPFSFPDNLYFDTGALFKATYVYEAKDSSLAPYRNIVLPSKTESLKDYCKRIIYAKTGNVSWSVAKMLNYYGLFEKHAIDSDTLHCAMHDCLCLVYIMEEFRSRITCSNLDVNELKTEEGFARAMTEEFAIRKLEKEAEVKAAEAKKAPSVARHVVDRVPIRRQRKV